MDIFLKTWFIAAAVFAVILLGVIYFRTIVVIVPLWMDSIFALSFLVTGKILSERA